RLHFSESTYRAKKNAGEVHIDVRRSGNTNQSVSVHYFTRDGSAVRGKDYKESNGSLNFAPGETNKMFRISVYNNHEVDGDRTLDLILSDPSANATLGPAPQASL